jgi:hypothetical protein
VGWAVARQRILKIQRSLIKSAVGIKPGKLMISYEAYKLIHLFGILLLMFSLGATLAPGHRWRRAHFHPRAKAPRHGAWSSITYHPHRGLWAVGQVGDHQCTYLAVVGMGKSWYLGASCGYACGRQKERNAYEIIVAYSSDPWGRGCLSRDL